MNHGTHYAYRQGCRCEACATANRQRVRSWRSRAEQRATADRRTAPPDDGIVDWVVVERLLAREMRWQDATASERKAAAARAFARGDEDAYMFASEFLRLRSEAIKAIRADLASWLAVAS